MRDEDHPIANCPGLPGDAPSVGALIRAAADAELTQDQVSEFERLCAERDCTRDRVRFEQTLRECCGRVMRASPACSDSLRAKVRAIAEQARLEAHAEQVHAEQVHAEQAVTGPALTPVTSAPERMAPMTRSPAFWRRSPLISVAAAVLLMVAGTLTWQASSLQTRPGNPAGWTTEQVSYRDRVSGFVADEHIRCCQNDEVSESKLIYRDLEDARIRYSQTFGMPSVAFDTLPPASGEVKFWGGGDCKIPGAQASGHLRFDAVDPQGNTMRLSLFVMPDNDRLPLDEGTTYRVSSEACEKAGVTLFAWKSNGLIHLLVSEADGEFCSTVRDSFQAPAQLAGR